jgi:hypothetical protein
VAVGAGGGRRGCGGGTRHQVLNILQFELQKHLKHDDGFGHLLVSPGLAAASVAISLEDSVNLLLASIAFEELGLAHLTNAEAEKIQYVLGTIEGQKQLETPPTLEDLLQINDSVDQTLKDIIQKEMLLQFQLEDVRTMTTTTSTTTTTTSKPVEAGSAWSVGTDFGNGNAQYTALGADETSKTVDLGLGADHMPIGSVLMERDGDLLLVTISAEDPYLMDQIHLYADSTAPTDSAPGQFPYAYETADPSECFPSYTFAADVSAFAGQTVYVAAHAHVCELT